MIGAQASSEQMEKILSYIKLGQEEGAELLTGGNRTMLEGEHADGYYIEPTNATDHFARNDQSDALACQGISGFIDDNRGRTDDGGG